MEQVCQVELDEFEGPLDLLLHLVRRHELDILDIPIAFVCEKYLEYIEVIRALDLEVAGEYLVMAATLAYLKSRELVPSDPDEEGEGETTEEGPDPREELISRLLQYQKFRDAASQLDRLPMAGRDTFARGQPVELPPVDAGLAPITLFRLAEAYHRVLERARILKSHEVVIETVSVAQRMEQLTTALLEHGTVEFDRLFLDRQWASEQELRGMLVVTLMSILELVRLGVAGVHQPEGAATLMIERRLDGEAARTALSGYDEAASFGTKAEGEGGGPPPPIEDSLDESLDPVPPQAAPASDAAIDAASDTAASGQSESAGPESADGSSPGAEPPGSPAPIVESAGAPPVSESPDPTEADPSLHEDAAPTPTRVREEEPAE